MIHYLKSFFEHKCPTCREPLQSGTNSLYCEKTCPHGHYKEETYHHLGVSIVFDQLK